MQLSPTLLLALCLAFCARPAPAAFINGHAYTPLADWADANGLRLVRGSRGDELLVTNRNTRLVFAKDSRTAQINGANVALSFPVAVDKGAAFITQLDLAKTVDPLIYPPKASAKKISTIVLDPTSPDCTVTDEPCRQLPDWYVKKYEASPPTLP